MIPLALLLAGCGESSSERATREGSQSVKLSSPEQRQFLTNLATFHSAVSSLAAGYDAAHKASALAQGLQNGSPAVMNMKGSDFVRKAESLSSAMDRVTDAKAHALFLLSALAQDYAILQQENPAQPQLQQFFAIATPSDPAWADSEESVSGVLDIAQALLEDLSAPGAWETGGTEQAMHKSPPRPTTTIDVDASAGLRQAAERGDAVAQFNLAIRYANGAGVPKDEAEEFKWYRKAAEQNLAEAQFNLGTCYATGQGVEKNLSEAVRWYRKAAEQNFAAAQLNLAQSYLDGAGVEKDEAEAANWYRRAAEQNYAMAQHSLGNSYLNGAGVEKNLSEAVKWYRKAAEQNFAAAQHNIGWCYANGVGVEKNVSEARRWYRKAAEQNFAAAQLNLGNSYVDGEGVEKNEVEGYMWVSLAATEGGSVAATAVPRLARIAPQLTSLQIKEAERRASEFRQRTTSHSSAGMRPEDSPGRTTRHGSGVSLAKAKWTKHLAESGVELQSVVWSGKEYVAVGNQGVILRSVDLQNWKRTVPATETWFTTVAWLGSRFVVGGNDGKTLTGFDGTSWSVGQANSKCFYPRFVSAGSVFVAVCDGGDAFTSPDGDNWTMSARISGAKIYQFHPFAIAWSGKQFVVVGSADIGDRNFRVSSGAIATSPDGVKWTTKTESSTLFDVVWTGTKFAAVNGDGFLLLSKDGIEWERWALPVEGAATSIAWTGTEYAIVAGGVVLTGAGPPEWKQHLLGIPMNYRVRAIWTGTKLLVTGGDSIFEAVL